jgi:hypothetical protein
MLSVVRSRPRTGPRFFYFRGQIFNNVVFINLSLTNYERLKMAFSSDPTTLAAIAAVLMAFAGYSAAKLA